MRLSRENNGGRDERQLVRARASLLIAELGQDLVCDRHPLIDGVTFVRQDHDAQSFRRDKSNVGSEAVG
jgi:hypothetical protein